MRILRSLARTKNKSILLSTHDLDLALRSADRIWLLPRGGPFQAGSPEDLVLSGAFEAAFHSEGVDFDRTTGAFRLHRVCVDRIALEGHGVHAIWTARALEREGFEITSSAEIRVRVVVHPDKATWALTNGDRSLHYDTLKDLLTGIRTLR
jgi:iron complex transport system ATP-binding protein